ncbi:STAS domain-containing protein [Aliiroseovarius crassostreae]|uniref:STAS domain-containing protein n=1 Tax=Aliiroseovarius crassostreae TaxID=154981 RepID=UPI003C7C7B66
MSNVTISLDAKLDMRAAGPLKETLLSHRGQDLALDASNVMQLGALSAQVLRAAARTWAEDGHSLTLINPSNDCDDQLTLLGFSADSLTNWEAA